MNQRPQGYGPCELPGCSIPQQCRVRVANLRFAFAMSEFQSDACTIRLDGQSFDAYLGTRTRICLLDSLFGRGWRRILDSNQVACEQDFGAPFQERGDLLVMISLTGWWGPSPVSGENTANEQKIQRSSSTDRASAVKGLGVEPSMLVRKAVCPLSGTSGDSGRFRAEFTIRLGAVPIALQKGERPR